MLWMVNLKKNIIRQALDLSPVATLIVDLKASPRSVQYVNQAFEALSGYDAGELLGRSWSELFGDDEPVVMGDPQHVVLQCHPRLGAAEQLILEMLPLYDGPGEPRYWLGTEQQLPASSEEDDSDRDALLSVLREARSHLRRLDGRDSITGLLSLRSFEELLQRDWVLARRQNRSLAMLYFRLDHFDAYSDVFGRHAVDACLRKIAHAITGTLRRAGDLTARCADDSFVVLMGEADASQADALANKIADRVRGLAIHHPRSVHDRYVTVSYGVTSVTPDGKRGHSELISKAEEAMQARPASYSVDGVSSL
jgi:diguanylate cyclase (GGDEF)-like protein